MPRRPAGLPLKSSLGSDAGLDVLAAGSPPSVPVSCETGAASGTATATENPGRSGLTYDAGVYQYNWKTETDWAGTCRQVSVQLRDGTVHTALFSFRT